MTVARRTTIRRLAATAAGLSLVAAISLRAEPSTGFEAAGLSAAPQAKPIDPLPLYRANCQMCHGIRGKAAIEEMAFVEREWKHGTTVEKIAKVITEGVKGTPMLAFKGKLKPDEIQALAKYVRSLDPNLKLDAQ